ncbi:hypothetical protein V1511DRAFT_485215 [Dipodascopsis uninucleata]
MSEPPQSPSWMDQKRIEAVEKVVLHRAKISRITRQLKNRLALASYKTKRGWENLDLDSIEPKLAQEVASRKHTSTLQAGSDCGSKYSALSSPVRPSLLSAPSIDSKTFRHSRRLSSNSNNTSHPLHHYNRRHGPPISASGASRKRARTLSNENHSLQSGLSGYMPWRTSGLDILDDMDYDEDVTFQNNPSNQTSHRHMYQMPSIRLSQSSPVYPGIAPPSISRYSRPSSSSSSSSSRHLQSQSYHQRDRSLQSSQSKSIVMNDDFPIVSGGPLQKLPNGGQHRARSRHSTASSITSTTITATTIKSPPRTPPRKSFSLNPTDSSTSSTAVPRTNEEGADLLLFLATSPSPAQRSSFPNSSSLTQTPPPRSQVLFGSSSGASPRTPSQGFNFSDYVNNIFTPSPAQIPWHQRTPIATPARRRLSFDRLSELGSPLTSQLKFSPQQPQAQSSQSNDNSNNSNQQQQQQQLFQPPPPPSTAYSGNLLPSA